MFASRRIERATRTHLSVRCLTGDTHPAHDTICACRREDREALAEAIREVLLLAKERWRS